VLRDTLLRLLATVCWVRDELLCSRNCTVLLGSLRFRFLMPRVVASRHMPDMLLVCRG
jgi:hypothetical protein